MNYDILEAHIKAENLPPPEGQKISYGGIECRRFDIPEGTALLSHCHVYPHLSILASGEVELWSNKTGLTVFVGPCEIGIEAGEKHAIQALTDVVWYCLHREDS